MSYQPNKSEIINRMNKAALWNSPGYSITSEYSMEDGKRGTDTDLGNGHHHIIVDCSAFVYFLITGKITPGAFSTDVMANWPTNDGGGGGMLSYGYHKIGNSINGLSLKPTDVLIVNKGTGTGAQGHTAMVYKSIAAGDSQNLIIQGIRNPPPGAHCNGHGSRAWNSVWRLNKDNIMIAAIWDTNKGIWL